MGILFYVRGSKKQEESACNILYFWDTQTIMKTFTIIAIIDKMIDVLDITLVLPIYLSTIYRDLILSPSSIKKLLRWPK
jgi:hypothetical protein